MSAFFFITFNFSFIAVISLSSSWTDSFTSSLSKTFSSFSCCSRMFALYFIYFCSWSIMLSSSLTLFSSWLILNVTEHATCRLNQWRLPLPWGQQWPFYTCRSACRHSWVLSWCFRFIWWTWGMTWLTMIALALSFVCWSFLWVLHFVFLVFRSVIDSLVSVSLFCDPCIIVWQYLIWFSWTSYWSTSSSDYSSSSEGALPPCCLFLLSVCTLTCILFNLNPEQ